MLQLINTMNDNLGQHISITFCTACMQGKCVNSHRHYIEKDMPPLLSWTTLHRLLWFMRA